MFYYVWFLILLITKVFWSKPI